MSCLCDELRTLSSDIFDWINAQPAAKEESLTDWLLYELSKRCVNVAYKAFTRHEEAKYTGADWDWLFVFSDGAAYFRVQAKKLSAVDDNYPGLARENSYGQQITQLISSARAISAFPIYAFYSSSVAPNACQGGASGPKSGSYLCGAQIVDSRFVKSRAFVSDSNVLSVSYPLPCIACCTYERFKSAQSLLSQVRHYFPIDTVDGPDNATQGYLQSIPDWAKCVLDNQMRFPDWWGHDFSRSFLDTNALIIIDNRD